jgi:type IV secretion system protein VirD4
MISRPFCLVTSRNNPAIMYAPDLTKWHFNKMFGLGNKEHNRKLRERREERRIQRTANINEMDLWGVWIYYMANQEQPDMDMSVKGSNNQYIYGEKNGDYYE